MKRSEEELQVMLTELACVFQVYFIQVMLTELGCVFQVYFIQVMLTELACVFQVYFIQVMLTELACVFQVYVIQVMLTELACVFQVYVIQVMLTELGCVFQVYVIQVMLTELACVFQVYVIKVTDGPHSWMLKHRYSDFLQLHDKLSADWLVDKQLLPPKKMLGKNSAGLVERRRRGLEAYLQTVLRPLPTPPPLAAFLDFDIYERSGVTASLAESLFHKGEALLLEGQVFSLQPLQLHAVWEQLRGESPAHLGHILDFTCRLRYLKIQGTKGPIGTSNIQDSSLTFDLSIFKSLLHVEVSECSAQQIQGLPSLRRTLATLSVHNTTSSMTAILAPEASEFPQWEAESAEGVEPGAHVTAVIPLWRKLTTLDLSHNTITHIDLAVKLVPEVEFLDLSHNQLQSVANLQHLYNLGHLDLSYNALEVLPEAHTCLGNIHTLCLAGNRLQELSGLRRLYSLVTLDLSNNLLQQLQEVRYIAGLPCLERVSLTLNPLCCCPDYRTRTLALFWDRAAEVCLDGVVSSQQEVDTVEVLKAIQKAKEAKDQRVAEETSLSLLSAAAPAVSSSSSSSPSLQKVCSSSQEQRLESREEEVVWPRLLCPVGSTPLLSQVPACQSPVPSNHTAPQRPGSGATDETRTPHLQDMASRPSLSSHLLSLSSNKDFITQLSLWLASHLCQQAEVQQEEAQQGKVVQEEVVKAEEEVQKEVQHQKEVQQEEEDQQEEDQKEQQQEEEVQQQKEVQQQEEKEVRTPGAPRYFEMGVGEESQPTAQEVRWGFCVEVQEEEEEVQQKVGCLVFTQHLLGLFSLSADCPWTNHSADQEELPCVEEVVSSLQREFLLPYQEVLLSCCLLPEPWVSLALRSRPSQLWFICPSSSHRASLSALVQTKLPAGPEAPPLATQNPQLFLQLLLSSWEQQEVHGGYPAHLLLPPTGSSPCPAPLLTDILNEEVPSPRAPALLFLTPRHLILMKVHFSALAAQKRRSRDPLASSSSSSSWCRLAAVPLGSLVLHPRHRAQHTHRAGGVVEVMLGGYRLGLVFPLAQDSLSFLGELEARTASLEGLRTVALYRAAALHTEQTQTSLKPPQGPGPLKPPQRPGPLKPPQSPGPLEGPQGPGPLKPPQSPGPLKPPQSPGPLKSPQGPGPLEGPQSPGPLKPPQGPGPLEGPQGPGPLELQRLGEENQPPAHLLPSLSPGQRLLAGLPGRALQALFLRSIAQWEGEELRQVLWLSVIFYTSPETEVTSCLLLSNKAIYFLLEDSASLLSLPSEWELMDQRDPELCVCVCLSLSLSDLLSVNVGLFDQYFRLIGRAASQVLCCVTRDSYATSCFLQQLMSALSLDPTGPEPEPAEQDFYTQFTSTASGKMQNYELVHSSRVRFIYPSEDEMADLTFIVADRKGPSSSSSSSSFNILLYLLVFQVQTSDLPERSAQGRPEHQHSPWLLPRTLVLTASHIFLLDEDYVSYPLPDFAKEPPCRGRYRVCEARQIRDVERVLLGYQTYPQALTLVLDELPGPDLLPRLHVDHFSQGAGPLPGGGAPEVTWCIFVPAAESRERLVALLARQWEALCSRELPLELTG